jgi:NAD(P)-dependent dehydrogenase (short-subunit alcohol dehydrogenase family)
LNPRQFHYHQLTMSERKLRILLVGASGTIGRAVARELSQRHEVITAGSKSGDIRIDLADPASIISGLKQAGALDAVVSVAGNVAFAPLSEFKPAHIADSLHGVGLNSKLMGQVNLALAARDVLRDGGSITLTSGLLNRDPIFAGSSASMVNGALEGFVIGAAIEMPRGIRINVVSPTVLTESMPSFGPYFRGFESAPGARVALAYSKSVEGRQTGQVYRVG